MMDKKKSKTQYDFRPSESTCTKPKRYLRLTDNMINSNAYQDLSCYAIAVYVAFKNKYNFTNEDNISLTYKEGQKLMGRTRFTKTLDELIEHGFIYIVRQGLLNKCTIYGLSDGWQYFDTKALEVKHRAKRIVKK